MSRFDNPHYVAMCRDRVQQLEAQVDPLAPPAAKRKLNDQLRQARLRLANAQGRHTTAQWQALVEETGGICVRCGYDHAANGGHPVKGYIVPLALGGSADISNIMPICRYCAGSKTYEKIDWMADFRHRRDHQELPEGA